MTYQNVASKGTATMRVGMVNTKAPKACPRVARWPKTCPAIGMESRRRLNAYLYGVWTGGDADALAAFLLPPPAKETPINRDEEEAAVPVACVSY